MTTRPTIEADKAVGTVLGAAEWNVNALQQARWTQEVLAGTNSDKIPGTAMADPFDLTGRSITVGKNSGAKPTLSTAGAPSGLVPLWNHSVGGGEVSFFNTNNTPAGNPFDFWYYSGSAWVQLLTLGRSGNLAGKGFYDSGEVSLASGGLVTLAHGLGARPRFYAGVFATTAGTTGDTSSTGLSPVAIQPNATSTLRVDFINNANFYMNNQGPSTAYFRIFGML